MTGARPRFEKLKLKFDGLSCTSSNHSFSEGSAVIEASIGSSDLAKYPAVVMAASMHDLTGMLVLDISPSLFRTNPVALFTIDRTDLGRDCYNGTGVTAMTTRFTSIEVSGH